MPTPGDVPAYHHPQSPQTPFTNRPHNSLHHTNFNNHNPVPPTSPGTTELPPISTALYSQRDSRFYDPTSDHGDRSVGRGTPRYDGHYPAQVRIPSILHR